MVYYEYFEADASPTLNSWFGGSPGTAPVAPTEVNFIDNMQEADISPVEDVTEDFVFDLEGTINVPATGNWTFFTSSDDGSRLYIDGNEVVNNDGLHGVVEQSGNVTLSAGPHSIRVQFFERGGGDFLSVSWQGPGTAKAQIPDSAFETIDSQSVCAAPGCGDGVIGRRIL